MWAPNRAAFFLSAASLFVSSARWLFHPVPAPAVLASGDSIASGASNGQHGRGDTEPQTYVGSLRQCGRWSTDWFDSHAPSVPAKANGPGLCVGLGSASTGDRESSVPAKPS